MDSISVGQVSQNTNSGKETRLEMFKLQMTIRKALLLKEKDGLKVALDRASELGMEDKDGLLTRASEALLEMSGKEDLNNQRVEIPRNNLPELKHPALDRPIIQKQNRNPKSIRKDMFENSSRPFIGNIFDLSEIMSGSPAADQNVLSVEEVQVNNEIVQVETTLVIDEEPLVNTASEEKTHDQNLGDSSSSSSESSNSDAQVLEQIIEASVEEELSSSENSTKSSQSSDIEQMEKVEENNVPDVEIVDNNEKQEAIVQDIKEPTVERNVQTVNSLEMEVAVFKKVYSELTTVLRDVQTRSTSLTNSLAKILEYIIAFYKSEQVRQENGKALLKTFELQEEGIELQSVWKQIGEGHLKSISEQEENLKQLETNGLIPSHGFLPVAAHRVSSLIKEALFIEQNASSSLEKLEQVMYSGSNNDKVEAAGDFQFWSLEFRNKVPEYLQTIQTLNNERLSTVQSSLESLSSFKSSQCRVLSSEKKVFHESVSQYDCKQDSATINSMIDERNDDKVTGKMTEEQMMQFLEDPDRCKSYVIDLWGQDGSLERGRASYKFLSGLLESWSSALDTQMKSFGKAQASLLAVCALPETTGAPTQLKAWKTCSVLVSRELSFAAHLSHGLDKHSAQLKVEKATSKKLVQDLYDRQTDGEKSLEAAQESLEYAKEVYQQCFSAYESFDKVSENSVKAHEKLVDAEFELGRKKRSFEKALRKLEDGIAMSLFRAEQHERTRGHQMLRHCSEIYFEQSTVVFCMGKSLQDMQDAVEDINSENDLSVFIQSLLPSSTPEADPDLSMLLGVENGFVKAEEYVLSGIKSMKRFVALFQDLLVAEEIVIKTFHRLLSVSSRQSRDWSDFPSLKRALKELEALVSSFAISMEESVSLVKEVVSTMSAQRKLLKAQVKTIRKDFDLANKRENGVSQSISSAQIAYNKAMKKLKKLQNPEDLNNDTIKGKFSKYLTLKGKTVEERQREVEIEVEKAKLSIESSNQQLNVTKKERIRSLNLLFQRLKTINTNRVNSVKWALGSFVEAKRGSLDLIESQMTKLEDILQTADIAADLQTVLQTSPRLSTAPLSICERASKGFYNLPLVELSGAIILDSLMPTKSTREIPMLPVPSVRPDDLESLSSMQSSAIASTIPSDIGSVYPDLERVLNGPLLNDTSSGRVFGVRLAVLSADSSNEFRVPNVVYECVELLGENLENPLVLGVTLEELKNKDAELYEEALLVIERVEEGDMHLSEEKEIVLAVVLKEFFKRLPEPVVPLVYRNQFFNIFCNVDPNKRVSGFKRLVPNFPEASRELLSYFVPFLQRVCRNSETTQVNSTWVAKHFGPLLLKVKEYEDIGVGMGMGTLGRQSSRASVGGRSGTGMAVQAFARLVNDSERIF